MSDMGAGPRVYLDCDGVLAEFESAARAVFGMPSETYEARNGTGAFWQALAARPDFFGGLELLPDALQLFDAVKHLGPIILTGLPGGDWAEPQKRRWAARHFPGVPMIATSAALKREHCHPGDALVDDWSRYRDLWEQAGGLFIHHRSAARSIAELRAHGFKVAVVA